MWEKKKRLNLIRNFHFLNKYFLQIVVLDRYLAIHIKKYCIKIMECCWVCTSCFIWNGQEQSLSPLFSFPQWNFSYLSCRSRALIDVGIRQKHSFMPDRCQTLRIIFDIQIIFVTCQTIRISKPSWFGLMEF